MNIFLMMVLIVNSLLGVWTYLNLERRSYLFTDRFGFTSTSTVCSQLGLVLSLNLYLLIQDIVISGGINLLLGICIGLLFGAMVNAQAMIAGVFNGGIGGMMGTMIGVVALDPTICGLPANFFTEQMMILFFSLLSLAIQALSSLLIIIAWKA